MMEESEFRNKQIPPTREQELRDNPPLCVDRETLRDKFAMAALTGLLSAEPDNEVYDLRVVTMRAYQVADAMLDARKK